MTECKFYPNYRVKCELCEHLPTVTLVPTGEPQEHKGLCGPCYFGESEAIDTSNWSDE